MNIAVQKLLAEGVVLDDVDMETGEGRLVDAPIEDRVKATESFETVESIGADGLFADDVEEPDDLNDSDHKEDDQPDHDDDHHEDDDDDDDDDGQGKRKKRRVRKRKNQNQDTGSIEGDTKASKPRSGKRKGSAMSKRTSKKRKRVVEEEYDEVRDDRGRFTYEAPPVRLDIEKVLTGPHQKITISKQIEPSFSEYASIRLPRLCPSTITSEVWAPTWSVVRESSVRQARYSRIHHQNKHPEILVDYKEVDHYDLHPKAIRVARVPPSADAPENAPPRLLPNAWIARWNDGSLTLHVGDTVLAIDKSEDRCVVLAQTSGKAAMPRGATHNDSTNAMDEDELDATATENEPDITDGKHVDRVDILMSKGLVSERWLAKPCHSEHGFEQRQNRLRDILRRSAGSKKTVQLLNLNEIAQMSNAQKRQEDKKANEHRYRRAAGGARAAQSASTRLDAKYLEDDESSYE